jgi:hypothetical protein
MKTRGIAGLIGIAAVALVAAGTMAPGERAEPTWRMPRPVEVNARIARSILPTWGLWVSVRSTGVTPGLLLRDGDLIATESNIFVYHDTDGQALKIDGRAGIGRMQGVVVSLELHERGARGWLDNASAAELAALRWVGFGDTSVSSLRPAIARLAAANPHVAMSYRSDSDALELQALFKPTLVFPQDMESNAAIGYVAQPQIETLIISASAAGELDGLSQLPHLRRLALGDWRPLATGPLPRDLPALRSLIIIGSNGLKDLGPLAGAPRELEELSIIGADSLRDISGLRSFPGLRTLLLNGQARLQDLTPLADLKQLEWLGFPASTTQQQFDAIVAAHAGLKVIDLHLADSIGDLSPLRALKGLQAIILNDRDLDPSVLTALKSLRFVGVGVPKNDSLTDSSRARIVTIRKALPDAMVVPVQPYCLGSGWLLLLVPATAVAWYVASRPRRAPPLPAIIG